MGKCFQFNFHLIWKPISQIQEKGELMLSSPNNFKLI